MNKVKEGFTLTEVLIAVAMIGLLLSPLFITQGSLLLNIAERSRIFERILKAKNFYWVAQQKAAQQEQVEFKLDKKIDNPPMILKYQIVPRSDQSRLKDFKDVYLEFVTIEWKDGNKKREDALVSLIFKPKKIKEK